MTETLAQPELNKQAIIRNLHRIADASVAHHLDGLDAFLIDNLVLRSFSDAIQMFGDKSDWVRNIYRGRNSIQSKYLSVRLEQPPFLEGASFLHAYSIDAGRPDFGVILPFDREGRLDHSRTVTAKWLMDEQPYSLIPYRPLNIDHAMICERISWVTQMAAADLAGYIDQEWPSTLEETLAYL